MRFLDAVGKDHVSRNRLRILLPLYHPESAGDALSPPSPSKVHTGPAQAGPPSSRAGPAGLFKRVFGV